MEKRMYTESLFEKEVGHYQPDDHVRPVVLCGRYNLVAYLDWSAVILLIILAVSLPISTITSARDICLGLVLLLWIARSALSGNWRRRRTPLDKAWIVYGLVVVLSLITAVDFSYSLKQFRGEYIKNFLLFLLVVQFVTSERRAKVILLGVLAGNLLMVSVGIGEFLVQGGSLITRVSQASSGWSSLHEGGGTYSTYLITIFPFLLWLVAICRRWWAWLLTIMLVSANIFSLYITFQRGAWVGFLVMVAVASILFTHRHWIRVTCVTVFLVAVGLGLWLAPRKIVIHEGTGLHSLGQLIREPEKSIGTRFTTWRVSMGYIINNPVKGAGFGRRSPVKKYDYFKGAGICWHAHNTLLNQGMELGVLGLVAFLYLWARLCLLGWRGYRSSPPDGLLRFLATALILMLVAVFFRNMFDDFFVDDPALLFWFLAGLVIAITEKETCDNARGVKA